jgi:hypothetical protein
VVQTFLAVFPHVVMLRPADVLIGSDSQIPDAQARLLSRLAEPGFAARLGRGSPAQAGSIAALVAGETLVWGPGTPRLPAALTDMWPRDEFFLNHPVRGVWNSPPPPELRPASVTATPR